MSSLVSSSTSSRTMFDGFSPNPAALTNASSVAWGRSLGFVPGYY
ncbi:hypothetical protein [Corynebacterium amycolatum]|nr:hypothetical protein [Corynebacterium amycolatum]